MILNRWANYNSYRIDGVSGIFLGTPNGIKVSTHAFYIVFEPYENSWGTMVTLRTSRNSVAKETSLLTSSRFI